MAVHPKCVAGRHRAWLKAKVGCVVAIPSRARSSLRYCCSHENTLVRRRQNINVILIVNALGGGEAAFELQTISGRQHGTLNFSPDRLHALRCILKIHICTMSSFRTLQWPLQRAQCLSLTSFGPRAPLPHRLSARLILSCRRLTVSCSGHQVPLSNAERAAKRADAQRLGKALVTVAVGQKGLTDTFLEGVATALAANELVKVRLYSCVAFARFKDKNPVSAVLRVDMSPPFCIF